MHEARSTVPRCAECVTLCGYITSSAVLWCEGRKEPRHGSLRTILFRPRNTEYLPTNPHNRVIFPVDLGFPYNLLNIPTNPHNMVIFPVGFPYNLQRAKFPYCRGIPLRVATLLPTLGEPYLYPWGPGPLAGIHHVNINAGF